MTLPGLRQSLRTLSRSAFRFLGARSGGIGVWWLLVWDAYNGVHSLMRHAFDDFWYSDYNETICMDFQKT